MSLLSQAPPPAALGVPTDNLMSLALLGKTALALVLVVGCVLLCGWLARRVGSTARSTASGLRVVSSTSLGQREKVVIVQVQGQWLVLGVTAQQVNTLAQMQAPPADAEADVLAGNSFSDRLAGALRRTVLRPDHTPGKPS